MHFPFSWRVALLAAVPFVEIAALGGIGVGSAVGQDVGHDIAEEPPPEVISVVPPSDPAAAVDVVLLAPEDVRAEWSAALQIELAPRGARVIPGDPPSGETVLMRDAEAQRIAWTAGARAAARVEVDANGWTLRVIGRDASQARVTPLASEADARTVALILVSLLDESHLASIVSATFIPPPPPPPSHSGASTDVAPAPAPATTTGTTGVEDADADIARGVEWSGRIGTGGFSLFNDRHFIPGAMLRGGAGLRADYFEGALLADAGLMLDSDPSQGSEIQPFARLCVEAGAALPFARLWAFHFGARGCGGIAELRKSVAGDPFFGGGGSFLVDTLGALVSAGGYLALSAQLSSSTRLYVRADLEGALLESSEHFGEFLPVLSALLSFH